MSIGCKILALQCLLGADAFRLNPAGLLGKVSLKSSIMEDAVVAVTSDDGRRPASLEWRPEGYESWSWRHNGDEIKVNYVCRGEDLPGTPLVLIHGFGASAFHWRFNLPALAADRPVYALDLVGFGLTDKPLVAYSPELWRDQVGAFVEEVVRRPAVLAGNSLGGFTALYAAANFPDRTVGCVLLNAAGRFSDPDAAAANQASAGEPGLVDQALSKIKEALTRAVIYGSFFVTKQPARISQVLKQVYPIDDSNVDDELVESIRFPADTSPNCPEVFYRVITRTSSTEGGTPTIDGLLPRLTAAATPLWLVWGESDPWIRPQVADKIQALKPDARRISVDAGHCPHDENPRAVNAALREIGFACDDAKAAS